MSLKRKIKNREIINKISRRLASVVSTIDAGARDARYSTVSLDSFLSNADEELDAMLVELEKLKEQVGAEGSESGLIALLNQLDLDVEGENAIPAVSTNNE